MESKIQLQKWAQLFQTKAVVCRRECFKLFPAVKCSNGVEMSHFVLDLQHPPLSRLTMRAFRCKLGHFMIKNYFFEVLNGGRLLWICIDWLGVTDFKWREAALLSKLKCRADFLDLNLNLKKSFKWIFLGILICYFIRLLILNSCPRIKQVKKYNTTTAKVHCQQNDGAMKCRRLNIEDLM